MTDGLLSRADRVDLLISTKLAGGTAADAAVVTGWSKRYCERVWRKEVSQEIKDLCKDQNQTQAYNDALAVWQSTRGEAGRLDVWSRADRVDLLILTKLAGGTAADAAVVTGWSEGYCENVWQNEVPQEIKDLCAELKASRKIGDKTKVWDMRASGYSHAKCAEATGLQVSTCMTYWKEAPQLYKDERAEFRRRREALVVVMLSEGASWGETAEAAKLSEDACKNLWYAKATQADKDRRAELDTRNDYDGCAIYFFRCKLSSGAMVDVFGVTQRTAGVRIGEHSRKIGDRPGVEVVQVHGWWRWDDKPKARKVEKAIKKELAVVNRSLRSGLQRESWPADDAKVRVALAMIAGYAPDHTNEGDSK